MSDSDDRTILKVQLPLAGDQMLLAYNQDRTQTLLLPMSDKWKRKVGGDLKSFWYGLIEAGTLRLDEPAPWQEW